MKELRRQLAAARDRAAAHHRATELAERLDDALDDEALDAGMTRALLAAALRALNMDVFDWSEQVALEVLQQEGGGPDLALDRRFEGWTVRRLRAGLAHLAAGKGPAAMLATAVKNWVPHLAREEDRQAGELEAALAEAEGQRVVARVGPALEKAAVGAEALQCVTRYEKGLGAELARTLSLYFALRAAGPSRAAETVDGEAGD